MDNDGQNMYFIRLKIGSLIWVFVIWTFFRNIPMVCRLKGIFGFKWYLKYFTFFNQDAAL